MTRCTAAAIAVRSAGSEFGPEVASLGRALQRAVVLPVSRNTNYGAEVPVRSVDLNDLQDMIIAGKHGELEVPVHASGFTPGSGAPVFGGISWLGAGGAAFTLFAPVVVPVGDRITRCRFNYNRENAGHVIVSLNYWDLTTGTGPNLVAQFDDNVAPVASTYHEIAGINVTVLTGQAFFLKYSFDAAASAANAQALGAGYFHDRL
jgi:hypothetical protein